MWLLYRLADLLYFFMYYFPGYRKKVVKSNLKASFPERSNKEIDVLAKGFYKNLADLAVEILKIPGLKKEEVQKRVKVNVELLHYYLDQQTPVVVLTGHQCNWEWLLLGCSVECRYPIDAVYKPLHVQFMDRLFLRMRSRFGARPLAMKDVYRSLIKNKNETRVLAMVADQTPAHSEIQYFTKFLNQHSAFFVGADKIVRNTGYPVLFLDMKRLKRGHYEATFHFLQEAPYDEKNFEVIEKYARMLEQSVLKKPSDWLWSHRRWKHQEMKIKRRGPGEE